MSLTRRTGHYARKGLPTGRVPGLRFTAAWAGRLIRVRLDRGFVHGLGTIPTNPGAPSWSKPKRAWGVRRSTRGPRAGGHRSDVGYPSRTPCASRAASLRSRATPGKVKGVPTRRTLAGSPGSGSVRPVSPGYLKQREALGSFGCRVAYHDHGSRSVGLRGVGTIAAGEPGMVPGLGQPGPRSRAVSSKATSPCR